MAGGSGHYVREGSVAVALYEKLNVDFEFSDERGRLLQLVHCGYRQINLLESKKGTVRGGHYHRLTSEAFFVMQGSVDVALKQGPEQETVRFQKGDFFLIRPNTVHSLSACEDNILLALYDVPVEQANGTKDIWPEEI